jgi:hypothetical protein
MEGTYLLAMRGPVFRRHDSYPGFRTELENRVGDGKGKGTSGTTTRPKVPTHRPGAHCFVRAMKRGNARGAKGAGHPRRDGVNGQPEELRVLAEGGSLLLGGTSRMNREVHVRICGGLGVQLPGPTRQFPGPTRRSAGNRCPYADQTRLRGPILLSLLQTLDQRSGRPLNCG